MAKPALAQSAAQITAIEQQINELRQQLKQLKQEAARRDAALAAAQHDAAEARAQAAAEARAQAAAVAAAPPPPQPVVAAAPPSPPVPPGEFRTGGLTIRLGGFIEAAGIFRSANETSDIASSFSAIPLGNSPASHENEFRESSRQSRISLLVHGEPDDVTKLTGYAEVDFQGAAPTANSNESNSYNPRLRQLYAQYDRSDWGFEVLAGQAWSLITPTKHGITARDENPPLVIDAQYVPGFSWTRQPQLRLVKQFPVQGVSLGISFENPQTVYNTSGYATAAGFPSGTNGVVLPVGGFANINNAGGSGFAPTVNYSDEIAPDVIVKAAWDPGFGHYEVYGLARFLHDRTDFVGGGNNATTLAGGGGVAAIIPVIPSLLDFQANVLAGTGIGRYGSVGLPDATIRPDGSPAPIPEVQALIGLIGHPNTSVDLYAYVGTEQEKRTSFTIAGKGYGYGSPLYVNSGCSSELSALACTGNTSGVTEGTIGAWWRFLHGNFGTMEVGAQYAYARRATFQGIGGAPSANENTVMLSFRYLPFQ
jgi:hypothetical protein